MMNDQAPNMNNDETSKYSGTLLIPSPAGHEDLAI